MIFDNPEGKIGQKKKFNQNYILKTKINSSNRPCGALSLIIASDYGKFGLPPTAISFTTTFHITNKTHLFLINKLKPYLKALPSEQNCCYSNSSVDSRLDWYYNIKHPSRPYKKNKNTIVHSIGNSCSVVV